jgi:hypothetical protein
VIPIYWTACPVCRVAWEVHDGIVCARIAELEAQVASLKEALAGLRGEALDNSPPTHRCRVCGALWWLGEMPPIGLAWSLRSPKCGPCCDNVAMGDQIEPLDTDAVPLATSACAQGTPVHPDGRCPKG